MTDQPPMTAEQQAIFQGETALAQAHLDLDIETIEKLLHPGYVILQPNGRLETKSEVLASYRTGQRIWTSARTDQLEVQIHGQTAVAHGRWQATGTNHGIAFAYAARFLSIWTKTEAGWQNLAYQSVEINVD